MIAFCSKIRYTDIKICTSIELKCSTKIVRYTTVPYRYFVQDEKYKIYVLEGI